MALLRPVKALTEVDGEVATLLEATPARAAAGAMVAAVAAMQEAISTELTGAETDGECEEIRSEARKQEEEGTYTEAPECS